MIKEGINRANLIACFIENAFDNLLNGNTIEHDSLIIKFLKENQKKVDVYFLAQVSICSIKDRVKKFEVNIPIVFMAEMGIIGS